MPVKPLIEVKDLGFSYGGNTVLENVSFSIDAGDYIGIVGPNGGGKTTLLKLLVGLLPLQIGSIEIHGIPVADFKNRSKIGYVPQRIAQEAVSFPATVTEIVESGRIPSKGLIAALDEKDREAIKRAMDIAHIADLKDRLMSSLSGGQRQRVYVARALASEPEMLILDEPFVGVDIATQRNFYAFLKELNEQRQLTILFVSHDIDVVAEEAKSILCLNRGMLCFGSSELLHDKHVMDALYHKPVTHLHNPTHKHS